MQPPTRNILDNPDQNLRYMRELAGAVANINAQLPSLAAGIAAVPTQEHPGEYLSKNGQKVLADLNIDLSATAKTNTTASAPTVDDDSQRGYNYFSRWIDTTGPTLYTCIDPSPGAAVWV